MLGVVVCDPSVLGVVGCIASVFGVVDCDPSFGGVDDPSVFGVVDGTPCLLGFVDGALRSPGCSKTACSTTLVSVQLFQTECWKESSNRTLPPSPHTRSSPPTQML